MPESRPARLATDHRPPTTAFTLVELMISLAMMIVLMYAVNFIFSSVGKATGTAQAVSAINRNVQAAQSVMYDDLSKIAIDGPCIEITSVIRNAWYTQADRLGDKDGLVSTWDTDGSGTETNVPVAYPSKRSHRLDMISFFARGTFPRQTGNDGQYISDMTASEEWLWYGHLRINSLGSFTAARDPGQGTFTSSDTANYNPDNYYATQWDLGRVPMLLIDKNADTAGGTTLNTGGGQVLDKAGNPQGFIDRNWKNGDPATTSMGPLYYMTGATYTPNPSDPRYGAGFGRIESARFDIAATTINDYRNHLKTCIDGGALGFDWYSHRFASDGRRFQINPFIVKPISAAAYSQQRGVFLNGCTQFIVEFAGNFIRQDNNPSSPTYGDALDTYFDPATGNEWPKWDQADSTAADPHHDKQIDFVVLNRGTPKQSTQIRWYGMPRSTTGNPTINSANGDVAPLWDIISAFPGVVALKATTPDVFFEKTLPTATVSADYANGSPKLTFATNNTYLAAWGPNNSLRPTMIRIVFAVDDQAGHLGDSVLYEYVFKVQ